MAERRTVQPGRRAKGAIAFAAGRLGEDCVCREYLSQGYTLVANRWRGEAGEIDLILRGNGELVFVEVKASRHHAAAALRIEQPQIGRICRAAMEFCAELATGLLTPMRFDVALVDRVGRVEIIENAFSGDGCSDMAG